MDTAKKQDLLNEKAEQYKTIDTAKKQNLFNKKAKQFAIAMVTNDLTVGYTE